MHPAHGEAAMADDYQMLEELGSESTRRTLNWRAPRTDPLNRRQFRRRIQSHRKVDW